MWAMTDIRNNDNKDTQSEAPNGDSQQKQQDGTYDIASDGKLANHIMYIALENAFAHDGSTADSNVLGKILGARKDLRSEIRAVSGIISDTVSKVNSMSHEEQGRALKKMAESDDRFAASEGGSSSSGSAGGSSNKDTDDSQAPGAWLPPLEDAEYGRVITRFPPEPNGYPHIGHAKAAIINADYAAKYGGRCILRIDDTNPDAERKEYLAGINVGLEWLGVKFKPEDVRYTSDDMEAMYKKGEELISSGGAYVCTCKKDDISKNRMRRKECKCCRNDSTDEHYKRWGKMHALKFKPGGAVTRFRGDMASDNAVMRDPVLFRIITTPHYRQGGRYAVWPSYDMAVAIEDSIHGITHAFRSKEFESRAHLIDAILDALNMRKPRQHYFARLAFDGMPTSKRVIKPLMEDGRITGYDDPRIPTLGGLKRRGIKPAAVRRFIESLGMTKSDTVAPFKTLEAFNRTEIDPKSTRLFMIRDAKRMIINDPGMKMTRGEIQMPNHPIQEKMGTRGVPASHDVYIPGSDFRRLEVGSIVRLLGLAYVMVASINTQNKHHQSQDGAIRGTHRYESGRTTIEDEDIAVHADYVADLSHIFNARDKLEFYDKKGIPISQEERARLEAKIIQEESLGRGEDVSTGKQKKPHTEEDAKMQWVARDAAVPIRLAIPKMPFRGEEFDPDSLEELEVYTEPHFNSISEGAEIQFVRYGYCRKDTGRRVIFTHD